MDGGGGAKKRRLCGRLNRHFKPMPRAFIIFTDLDGTFTPIGLEGLKDFADVVEEITNREKVQVRCILKIQTNDVPPPPPPIFLLNTFVSKSQLVTWLMFPGEVRSCFRPPLRVRPAGAPLSQGCAQRWANSAVVFCAECTLQLVAGH